MLDSSTTRPGYDDRSVTSGSPFAALIELPKLVRRQVVIICVVAVLVIAGAATYVAMSPPVFTAETNVIIETRKVPLLHQPAVVDDANLDGAAIESQIQILKSDSVALAVIERLHLNRVAEFVDPPPNALARLAGAILRLPPAAPARSEAERTQAVLEAFQRQLDVGRVGSSYVLSIRFKSSDPKRAAQIANAVADAFIAGQRKFKAEAALGAGSWLQQRLLELREQSLAADKAVVDYKANKNIITTKGQLINDQVLGDLNAQALTARTRTFEARTRLDQILRILQSKETESGQGGTVADALSSPVLTKLRTQYIDLSNRLGEWSARFGSEHLAVVDLRRQLQRVRAAMASELNQLAETYKSDYAIAREREALIGAQLRDSVAQLRSTNQAQSKLFALESAAQAYRALYDTFLQRFTEIVQKQPFSIDEARIITRASPPVAKSQPKTRLILGFSAFAGLLFGFGAGLLRDKLEGVFRTRSQVEDALQADCIAMVPEVKAVRPRSLPSRRRADRCSAVGRIISRRSHVMWWGLQHPYSSFAESLRSIKMAADQRTGSSSSHVIGLTSSLPDEGKSVTAAALALSIAELGYKVILVDCDLRNPSLSRSLAPGATGGMLNVASGHMSLEEAIWQEPSTGLAFLPGSVDGWTASTSEILSSQETQRLFNELRATYRYIIVDLSPLAPIVDVRASVNWIDSYAYVIQWGKTKTDVVEHALKTTRVVYDNLLGIILSRVDFARLKNYETNRVLYYCNKEFKRYNHSSGKVNQPLAVRTM